MPVIKNIGTIGVSIDISYTPLSFKAFYKLCLKIGAPNMLIKNMDPRRLQGDAFHSST